MAKQPTQKETKKLNLIKLLQLKTQELKENIRHAKQKNAPFKILICVVNQKEGPQVAKFLNDKKINVQLFVFAKDYSSSLAKGVFALDIVDQDLILSLVDNKKTANLLQELSATFDLNCESEHKFACILPPSSATLETIKLLVHDYKKPIQL